ncbi:MAG: lysophospholipid acyltransferase family protein [Candidatus Omnitrophica bacterium]|nr:lysophospholipid acyltransferase family protein [Candidatus Omnitrophota bacterium]MDD5352468.1 lysophospholipid acyltransferase family protein [Candidatus Omnitrophota bacterium]MDD5550066.1 lysophospholipid acyltransferase family protein [Candidatus Omnitrophota bacterium]
MLNILYKVGEILAVILPWNIAYKMAVFLAKLQFSISKKDRDAVMNNLRVILPNEKEDVIRKKAIEVFVNFGLYLIEFFRFSQIDKAYIEKHFSIKGRDNLDNALKKGKGVILLAAHLGNWELAGMALSILGYKLMVVALDHKDSEINNFFKRRRQSKGIEVISLGSSIKQCYKGLKDNKVLAILGDRDFSNSGYPLDFFGRKKSIPRGPAVLSLRTGAPILPTIVTRQSLDRCVMECLPPIEISSEMNELEVMKKYTKIIEQEIAEDPSQWLMFREFWKE